MIEWNGFHAAWLNAVDFMQHGPKHYDWMQWSPCSVAHASRLNVVYFIQPGPKHPDWMQWIPCSIIECRGFRLFWRNGSRLYAVESMQWGQMHPNWMKWILCSKAQIIPLNAVDSMQRDWMQCTPYSLEKRIPIECSVFHAAWLNAVYSMQREEMEPYWMQWIFCIQSCCIESTAFNMDAFYHSAWNPLHLITLHVIHGILIGIHFTKLYGIDCT